MGDNADLPAFHCYCIGVTRQQVIDAFEQGARAVEELRSSIRVCTGCATCRPDLEALLAAMKQRRK
jgi:NAD(P)H-nitrite reductase large subunit